ncbi:MAG TPA: hypothetical protein VFK02_11885 [Kofleriaceae bacterium]|nr:hypothetical protein [Kofleriaceae bacterium]
MLITAGQSMGTPAHDVDGHAWLGGPANAIRIDGGGALHAASATSIALARAGGIRFTHGTAPRRVASPEITAWVPASPS